MVHGGAEGVRDVGLLESAPARPKQLAAYGDNTGVTDLAAAYTTGIVTDNPFVDGNERTGFVLGMLFLELNSLRFTASEELSTRAVLELAAGTTSITGYAAFLRESVVDD